ncbi:MAG TPA: nitrilase-related carbon-nitrogen hydrolase [Bacteroidales bacterium]|nr:nitrilase-related carbon-nitrogen hydrolase [Bacteroidales bacterium]HNS47819.1 nitrilase-related carbon-nitrogen hydrolase [Bacteroidales bacterium]
MQDITLTLIQADLIWGDRQANLQKFTERLQQIPAPADIIVLPEMFTTGFVVEPESLAETTDGPSMQWLKEQASLRQALITGSIIIQKDGHYLNRMIWMRPDGTWDYYDKRHLFTFGGEHHRFTRGDLAPVFTYKGWKFKPLICYDLRFPVWCKNKLREATYDYDVLIDIASWPDVRRNAWTLFLASRAMENMAYAVGVNRVGKDANGVTFSGDTTVVDPLGNPLVTTEPCQEALVAVTLSFSKLTHIREHFGFGRDWDSFQISDIR